MPLPDPLYQQISSAHAEALRVGDSPLRADQVAKRLTEIKQALETADLEDDLKGRLQSAIADAERVLRRDDDGREAAKHLQAALRLAEDRPRPPSPFLD